MHSCAHVYQHNNCMVDIDYWHHCCCCLVLDIQAFCQQMSDHKLADGKGYDSTMIKDQAAWQEPRMGVVVQRGIQDMTVALPGR